VHLTVGPHTGQRINVIGTNNYCGPLTRLYCRKKSKIKKNELQLHVYLFVERQNTIG
jgi:hypothetical protein